MRVVICHYHIFKNSGSSFDKILTNTFGGKHIKFDGPFPFFSINMYELEKIISRKKDASAFSSHQIFLPVPQNLEYKVIPVCFIRHPIARIYSIYKYKRLVKDETLTSNLACKYDFGSWLDESLKYKTEHKHISNSQTAMLTKSPVTGRAEFKIENQEFVYNLEQLNENIKDVMFFLRTEFFEDDIRKLNVELKKFSLELDLSDMKPVNTTDLVSNESVEDKLLRIKSLIGTEKYNWLCRINSQDLNIYEKVSV